MRIWTLVDFPRSRGWAHTHAFILLALIMLSKRERRERGEVERGILRSPSGVGGVIGE